MIKTQTKDGISASFTYLPSFIKTTHPGDWQEKYNKKLFHISQNPSATKYIFKNPIWAWISAKH